jgi:hypothetical protein
MFYFGLSIKLWRKTVKPFTPFFRVKLFEESTLAAILQRGSLKEDFRKVFVVGCVKLSQVKIPVNVFFYAFTRSEIRGKPRPRRLSQGINLISEFPLRFQFRRRSAGYEKQRIQRV